MKINPLDSHPTNKPVVFPGTHASTRTTCRRRAYLPAPPAQSDPITEICGEPEPCGDVLAFPVQLTWGELGNETRHHTSSQPRMILGQADLGHAVFVGKWLDVFIDGHRPIRVYEGYLWSDGKVIAHFSGPTVLTLAA